MLRSEMYRIAHLVELQHELDGSESPLFVSLVYTLLLSKCDTAALKILPILQAKFTPKDHI